MQAKEKLRTHFLHVRKELSIKEVSQKSVLITEKLIASDEFQNASVVHCYVTILQNREVDTTNLIKTCLEMSKHVIVPKTEGEGILSHHRIQSLSELVPNRMGIPEPETPNYYPCSAIDLVVVPMVAADRKKNRLGYGKGYYDRFLEKCDAIKTGVLFHNQLYSKLLPAEPFDVPMDILFTEHERIG